MGHDQAATLGSGTREAGRTRLPDRWLTARLQRVLAAVHVRVQLWDGYSSWGAARHPLGTLVVGDRRTLVGLIVNPELAFGEAYTSGALEVQGDLENVLEALFRVSPRIASWRDRLRARLAPAISLASARRNARRHYDLGNEFYRLWLDDRMVYTCAHFPAADTSLEEAQLSKFGLVCRKLRLQPGERVLETGSGWGALALHMARHCGVDVVAYNVSHEQVAYARQQAAREGLAERVTFVEDDYRNARGEFDAFVSVGMLEHVGRRRLGELAAVLHATVRRHGGRGLLHFIGRDTPRPLNAWIRRRIFPGAYPPTLAEVIDGVLAPAGMSVVDVENLRLHYAQTLVHWTRRYDEAAEQVAATHGHEFCRAWKLYLAGSQAAFATGWLQLFQVVFTPLESAPPFRTRADLYAPTREP